MLFKHVCCVAGKAVRILSYIFDIWLLKLGIPRKALCCRCVKGVAQPTR